MVPMRRKDREILPEAAMEILKNGTYGVLSLVDPEDNPYGVPVSYAYEDGRIWFHGAIVGRKCDCIMNESKASFCVVGQTETLPDKFSTRYESVIAEGKVRVLQKEEKLEGLRHILEKYASAYMDKGTRYAIASLEHVNVWCMEELNISGKARKG